jgi:hypothetical protein
MHGCWKKGGKQLVGWFTTTTEEASLLLPVIMIEANSLSGQNVDTEKQMVTWWLLDGICDE